jgi:hypothetical protein
MHLVILPLPNLKEELKVLFYETVGKVMRWRFFLLVSLFVATYNDFLVYTCHILQLPTWRNLLLHLVASVIVVRITQLDYWGG